MNSFKCILTSMAVVILRSERSCMNRLRVQKTKNFLSSNTVPLHQQKQSMLKVNKNCFCSKETTDDVTFSTVSLKFGHFFVEL